MMGAISCNYCNKREVCKYKSTADMLPNKVFNLLEEKIPDFKKNNLDDIFEFSIKCRYFKEDATAKTNLRLIP